MIALSEGLRMSSMDKCVFVVLLFFGVQILGCEPHNRHSVMGGFPIEEAEFAGSDIGFVITATRDLLRTEDGGANWKTIPGAEVGKFEKISFVDERLGWAFSSNGRLWRTVDSGACWSLIAQFNYYDESFGGPVSHLTFISDLQGWLVTPFCIWRTEDGGVTWVQYRTYQQIHETLCACQFLDSQKGWLFDQSRGVYFTQDSGKTWMKRCVELPGTSCFSTFFVDEKTGWVQSENRIYRTDDGGHAWLPQELEEGGLLVDYFHNIGKNNFWITGFKGRVRNQVGQTVLLHSTDEGHSWELTQLPENRAYMTEVHFSNSEKGWLLIREDGSDSIYRTEDGGRNWSICLRLDR